MWTRCRLGLVLAPSARLALGLGLGVLAALVPHDTLAMHEELMAAAGKRAHRQPLDGARGSFLSAERARQTGDLRDFRLEKLLKKHLVKFQSVTVVLHACHCGGFIDELIRFGADATGRVSVATGCTPGEFCESDFHRKWALAFLNAKKPITVLEMFEDAAAKDAKGVTVNPDTGRITGEIPAETTPLYHSTGSEADRTVLGRGFFPARGREPVRAKALKILAWVGKEYESERGRTAFDLLSAWAGIQELVKLPQAIVEKGWLKAEQIETRVLYTNFELPEAKESVLVRYDRNRGELTTVEKADERTVQVHGPGTIDKLDKTLEKFAEGLDADTQVLLFLAGHGLSDAPKTRDPDIAPGGVLEETVALDSVFLDTLANPMVFVDAEGVVEPANRVFVNDLFVGTLTPGTGLTELFFGAEELPLLEDLNRVRIECNQGAPCTIKNLGLAPDARFCPLGRRCTTGRVPPVVDGGVVEGGDGAFLGDDVIDGGMLALVGALGSSVSVTIPPGVLPAGGALTLCRAENELAQAVPSGFALAAEGLALSLVSFELFPEGLEFSEPVMVSVQYLDAQIAGLDEGTLEPRRFDPATGGYSMDGVNGGTGILHDPAANRMAFRVSRTGTFALIGRRLPARTVRIDINPGNARNVINPGSRGKVRVAILSAPDWDAWSRVDRFTLTFGRSGAEESFSFCEPRPVDIDGDGVSDLVCHFEVHEAGFEPGDSRGILRGATADEVLIEGEATI